MEMISSGRTFLRVYIANFNKMEPVSKMIFTTKRKKPNKSVPSNK